MAWVVVRTASSCYSQKSMSDEYYVLDPAFTDPARIRKEREKAQKLRKSQWWLSLVNQGLCHYCGGRFPPKQLTMDHVVPLARGGTSTQGNIVPACQDCNRKKKLETPAERLLKEIADAKSAWGDERTQFFFELTPDRVIGAVEASGLRCTGRCSALNSFENRVYEVELERDLERVEDDPTSHLLAYRRVVKFYRPGRWSREQILEEHRFLADLRDAEVPAIAPIPFADGETLHEAPQSGIWYALFPKIGGRAPDEFSSDPSPDGSENKLIRIGRLLGRMHNVGATRKAEHRLSIGPDTYGRANLSSLVSGNWIPLEFKSRYVAAAEKIFAHADRLFSGVESHRIHGDCHAGNLLWNQEGPFFLDFDDMLIGPSVQDIWLLVPGRDEASRTQREILLKGYSEMRRFDRAELRLVESLRALRFIHYTAWIARRWDDPAFPLAFPEFNTHRYWADETTDLETQLALIEGGA